MTEWRLVSSNEAAALICCGEKRSQAPLNLLVHLNPKLKSRLKVPKEPDLGSKEVIFLRRGAAPPHQNESAEVVHTSDQDVLWTPPLEVY